MWSDLATPRRSEPLPTHSPEYRGVRASLTAASQCFGRGRPAGNAEIAKTILPGPTRRRPWTPCATVAAMRSAATSKGGKRAAVSSARCLIGRWTLSFPIAEAQRVLGQRSAQPFNYLVNGYAIGPGREAERHAVPQHRFRQCDDVVDGWRVATVQ